MRLERALPISELPLQLELMPSRRQRPLVAVRLPGQPVRAKFACTCHGGRPGVRPLADWQRWRRSAVTSLAAWWGGAEPVAVPVQAQVVAVFARPQRARRSYAVRGRIQPYPWPWVAGRVPFVGRPDLDQVLKAAWDVLVHAQILLDDQLIQGDAGSCRLYAAEGEEPAVEVRLWAA